MLWISSPVITTADEGTGPKLNLSEESTGDEEGGEPKDDNGSVEALAKEFKGQRWDADKSRCGSNPRARARDHQQVVMDGVTRSLGHDAFRASPRFVRSDC